LAAERWWCCRRAGLLAVGRCGARGGCSAATEGLPCSTRTHLQPHVWLCWCGRVTCRQRGQGLRLWQLSVRWPVLLMMHCLVRYSDTAAAIRTHQWGGRRTWSQQCSLIDDLTGTGVLEHLLGLRGPGHSRPPVSTAREAAQAPPDPWRCSLSLPPWHQPNKRMCAARQPSSEGLLCVDAQSDSVG
jgi:hypothetical protein